MCVFLRFQKNQKQDFFLFLRNIMVKECEPDAKRVTDASVKQVVKLKASLVFCVPLTQAFFFHAAMADRVTDSSRWCGGRKRSTGFMDYSVLNEKKTLRCQKV